MRFHTLIVTFSLLIAACSATIPDELDGDDPEVDDTKADSNASATYFTITGPCSDPRVACDYTIRRVNRATTRCPGGADAAECVASFLDLEPLGLMESKVLAAIPTDEQLASNRRPMLIARGRLVSRVVDLGGEAGQITAFVPTELWLATSPGEPDAILVRVRDRGTLCESQPCESLDEQKLNSTLSATIAKVDVGDLGLTAQQQDAFTNAKLGGGVIVAGDRYQVRQNGRTARGRRASAAFLPFSPR